MSKCVLFSAASFTLKSYISHMKNQTKLEYGCVYHIYQRGNNREPIFFEPENYRFFLAKYVQFIEPVAQTYAYCLLSNHFHLLIKTKTVEEQELEQNSQTYDFLKKSYVSAAELFKPLSPSNQFRKLFISYAKAMNKRYGRTGSLFENRFGRKEVFDPAYFQNLVVYIHQNPEKHGMIDDFREWPYSSYGALVSKKDTRVAKTAVFSQFDTPTSFMEKHSQIIDMNLELSW